jgi:hypothetical protein
MKKLKLIPILLFFPVFILKGQVQKEYTRQDMLKTIEYSNPDLLRVPAGPAHGFPSRNADLDVLQGFKSPPVGYGEVPFWWWSGDPLDKNRLLWQIEELKKKGITGMQINYIHKDSIGLPTYPGEPDVFTDRWWEMWKFAADEAGKRSMGIGMSGYTIDWPNSVNLFNRIIYSIHEIQGQELLVDTILTVKKGERVSYKLPDNRIQVWVYPVKDGKITPGGKSLTPFVKENILSWIPEEDYNEIWIYSVRYQPGTLNPMHILSGKTVIDKFFQPFEDHTSDRSSEWLNYFFQDELKFGVGDLIWVDDFNEVFKKDKGYDLFELLPGMFKDIGPLTTKVLLDFMDIKVRLTEERYFKPIFDWHWSRGKIYGCDPEGRGRRPGEYGDNFRANRWYTAPGHDTPSGKADLIKGKVSSSIAALYKRPRVWLEGYHSLGWGATPEQIMFATNENYLYGCNLLNLHGLYYTTHGSYWEWAPPCYHFRMPYWDHMTVFLKYFERLSYLLSQGVLQSDIAIMYPVSTVQAKMDERRATNIAFKSGTDLFNNGYDFIFMDDQSVIRSEIVDGRLNVSDQAFKVLILPSLKAIRWSTLAKAQELFHNGGIVIAIGSLPEASDRAGAFDPLLNGIVRELFGFSATEIKSAENFVIQNDKSGGLGLYINDSSQLVKQINLLLPKNVQSDDKVKFMYRKAGFRDLYMVMGATKNSWVTFRSSGKAEIWDPWSGNTLPLYEVKKISGGTKVKMPMDSTSAQIIVFSPDNEKVEIVSTDLNEVASLNIVKGKPEVTGFALSGGKKLTNVSIRGEVFNLSGEALPNPPSLMLDGNWEFELKPTMNNQWGDFRLPVTEQMIGAEARIFRYAEEKSGSKGWELPDFNDSKWVRVSSSFGQKFWRLGPLPRSSDIDNIESELSGLVQVDPSKPVIINGRSYFWAPYDFSWRFGFEGDPGPQGYHGLKEVISNDFICLGKQTVVQGELEYLNEKEGSLYYLWTSAYSENISEVTVDSGGLSPSSFYLNGVKAENGTRLVLEKGSNPLLLRYDKAGRGHFVLLDKNNATLNERTPLSMKWWNNTGRIKFDIYPSEKPAACWYRFIAPPGLKSMTIRATSGDIKVWIDGKSQNVKTISTGPVSTYIAESGNLFPEKSVVAIRVVQTIGDYGGSALPEPVLVTCGAGITRTGDWSKGSVLENYSGGAWYRKKVVLSEIESHSRVLIDLGKVAATAEIHVNGSLAGIIVTSPWETDISEWVRRGENKIEVLVYNTLANHYLTIPTRYKGSSLQSGLIGPVQLKFNSIVKLN